jgi:hypothetical protein
MFLPWLLFCFVRLKDITVNKKKKEEEKGYIKMGRGEASLCRNVFFFWVVVQENSSLIL